MCVCNVKNERETQRDRNVNEWCSNHDFREGVHRAGEIKERVTIMYTRRMTVIMIFQHELDSVCACVCVCVCVCVVHV